MKKMWATLVGLALVLPMGAYVAGTLVGSDREPTDHTPIELRESDPTSSTKPKQEKSTTPDDKGTRGQNGHDGRGDGDGDGDDDDDDGPKTVNPLPDDLDDDDDDDGGRDRDDDDEDDGDDGEDD